MSTSQSFSLERVNLFSRRMLIINQPNWTKAAFAFAGIILVFWLLNVLLNSTFMENPNQAGFDAFEGLALFIFVLLGLGMVNEFFKELQESSKASQFLMTPATTTEKMTSAIVLTMPVYVISSMLLIFVLSIFINGISYLIHDGFTFSVFNPFTKDVGTTLALFVVFHSIFMFGAVFFRKSNILKTVLGIAVVSTLLGFLIAIVGFLVMKFSSSNEFFFGYTGSTFSATVEAVIWIATIGFFWFMSFRQLAKRKV